MRWIEYFRQNTKATNVKCDQPHTESSQNVTICNILMHIVIKSQTQMRIRIINFYK